MSDVTIYHPVKFYGIRREHDWRGSPRDQPMMLTFAAVPRYRNRENGTEPDMLSVNLSMNEARRVYRELHEIFRKRS